MENLVDDPGESAGGKLAKATLDVDVLRLAEMVRAKLVQDGMFLVGLEIVFQYPGLGSLIIR